MHKNSFKFCFGAMGCGKTNELIGDYYKKISANKEVIVIKPKTDKKGATCIISRSGIKIETTFAVETNDNVYDLITKYLYENQLDYILVDEIQFFSEEHIKQLSKIVTQLGISIIGYGIITDFQGNMFPGAIHVMEYADDFKYLPSECKCGNLINRNMRVENGIPVFEGEQVSIDGIDSEYIPVCIACYEKEKSKAKKRILKIEKTNKKS